MKGELGRKKGTCLSFLCLMAVHCSVDFHNGSNIVSNVLFQMGQVLKKNVCFYTEYIQTITQIMNGHALALAFYIKEQSCHV